MSQRPLKFKEPSQDLFQRSDVQFDLNFRPFVPAPILCSLESVTNPREFGQRDVNIFEFHNHYTELFPNALPALCLAAKLATAIALSEKWLYFASEVIQETHGYSGNGGLKIKSCTEFDITRMRGLLMGGFRVVLDNDDHSTGYGRGKFTCDPRRIALNANFVREIEICAQDDSSDAAVKKEALRKYAVLVAVTLVRECGGHALHTMVRPDYFFDIPGSSLDASVKPRIDQITGKPCSSPPYIIRHPFPAMIKDFGTACEQSYFCGAVPGMLHVDPNNPARPFQMAELILNFGCIGFKVVVPTVASVYFQGSTYEGDADGLFYQEIEDALPTVQDLTLQIAQAMSSTSSSGAKSQGAEVLCELAAEVLWTRFLDAELVGLASADPAEMLSGCGNSTATKRC